MIATEIPDDCRELWRVVAECIAVLNALQNMTVKIEGLEERMTGKLEISGGSCILKINAVNN